MPSATNSLSDVDAQLELNVEAVTHLSHAVLPGFLKRNEGTLINLGSVLSFYVLPVSTAYSATKSFVMLFTLGLQQELAVTKVRVQLVLPASTATEIGDVAGVGPNAFDAATVMSAEDCGDAALAGLEW